MHTFNQMRLAAVACFLLEHPDVEEKFTMDQVGNPGERENKFNSCNTPGCVLGWTPYALSIPTGIGELAETYFGLEYDIHSPLFGEEWAWLDNTAKGAAARIFYWLDETVQPIFHPAIDPCSMEGELYQEAAMLLLPTLYPKFKALVADYARQNPSFPACFNVIE